MSKSIQIAALCAVAAVFSAPAIAQSSYQCVGGELLGGPQGFACETDANGRIVNVKPRAFTQTAPQPKPMPRPQTQSQSGTTVYRGTARTHVPHQPAPRQYTAPRTTTSTTTRTYTYSQQPAPVTRTYSYTQQPAPQAYTYRHQPAPQYHRPVMQQRLVPLVHYECADDIYRLNDTRDGRRQYEVCYTDLRPLDYRSAVRLYDRINRAARKACRGQTTGSLISRDRSCRRDALEQAVFDVDSPSLDAVYSDKTGRAIPRVRVGRPIYR